MPPRLFSLACPYQNQGCARRFRSQAGRTNHVRTVHHPNNNIVQDSNSPAPVSPGPSRFGSETRQSPPTVDSPEPQPPSSPSPTLQAPNLGPTRNLHPHLNARPCDSDGNFLEPGTPAEPRGDPAPDNWGPFDDEAQFTCGDFLYRQAEMSAGNIDILMDTWALSMARHNDYGPFSSHEHMYAVIDAIEHGDAPWKSFTTSYAGTLGADAPSWQLADYEVWYRDPNIVIQNILDNPDFKSQFNYTPYVELDQSGKRRWNEFMSGNFSWRHATDIFEADNTTEGSMYCPVILGADKTTVSVATGHVEYHPLYLSIGNVHNTVRRAHRNAVVPIGFLAIPKGDRKHDNDASFRKFKRQLYHSSISAILKSLRPGMTNPIVRRCPDGHYRRVIYDLAGFIADYPEQVALAGIVQGWCPRCTAQPKDLDGPRGRRTRSFTNELIKTLDSKVLWDEYGIDDDVSPFTNDFPRADAHEILTPDLLHQVIKGTFKDHLVTWVGEYLKLEHGERRADEIMDDIDRRIAAAPLFPNLRRFPHGRRFKQWTGDDSKALMKIYISAITGHVPSEMVQAISAFMDEFGAPGGVCSSITESRHITAVKKPWQHSNRYQALGQMLLTNQHLDKLAALRVDLVHRGMLASTSNSPNSQPSHLSTGPTQCGRGDADNSEGEGSGDEGPVDSPTRHVKMVTGNVVLACTRIRTYPRDLKALSQHINQPTLPELTRRFLFDQLNTNRTPHPTIKISVFHSAVATFYAPSDECGLRGMYRERIRSCPMWRKKAPRRDCAFVVQDESKPSMRGMSVVRVHLFFSFYHAGHCYPCALVEWFNTCGRSRDPITGMWKVQPDIRNARRFCTVLHLDTFLRGAHLLPAFGSTFIPINFHYIHSLDAFSAYYVNHFADHHSHEIVF
ncbi:hypothetical protein BD779DRAFT_1613705 [Infundibulicybe gibba]|nr:hypothetical protein BD779DRAFT_1613705 [Infundibulicybe gibba]